MKSLLGLQGTLEGSKVFPHIRSPVSGLQSAAQPLINVL